MRIRRELPVVKCLAALVLVVAFAPSARPQAQAPVIGPPGTPTTRSIEGAVLDAKGAPVPGAIVLLKDTKTLQIRSYIGQNDGQYHFFGLSTDVNYELRAEANGMTSPRKTVSVFDSHKTSEAQSEIEEKDQNHDKFMTGAQILAWIKETRIVPIVRTPDAETAIAAVEALREGGIDCVEITMTVQNALKALASVAERYGDQVLLGAGTVLDPETARACILAGANFIVTPALNIKTIEMARRYAKPVFPGGLTPTEVLNAWEAGADAVKVFPCNALGGPKYIKSLKAPLPQIELFPTGGVNLDTVAEFFAAGSMAVGMGSELVDSKSITERNYSAITERARKFRELGRSGQTRREMTPVTAL